MKKIHFNFLNGEVVEPFTVLPSHYALISKGIVKEVYLCFSVRNIAKHGQDWVQEQLAKELKTWEEYNPNLKRTLNKLVKRPKYWFKDTNHIEQSYDRFIYIRFY